MVAEALGLAIEVQPKVERIIAGSSAEKELKPGDTITGFKVVLDDPPQTYLGWLKSGIRWLFTGKTEKPVDREPVGGESFSWPFVFRNIQVLSDLASLPGVAQDSNNSGAWPRRSINGNGVASATKGRQ